MRLLLRRRHLRDGLVRHPHRRLVCGLHLGDGAIRALIGHPHDRLVLLAREQLTECTPVERRARHLAQLVHAAHRRVRTLDGLRVCQQLGSQEPLVMRLRIGEHPLTHLLPPLALRREHELIRKRRLFLDANGRGLGSFPPRSDETLRLRLQHRAAAQHAASMQLHLLGARAAGLLSPPVREPRLRCGACRHVGRLGVGPLVILLCHQCVVVQRLPLGERDVLPHQRVAPQLNGGVLGEQLGALALP